MHVSVAALSIFRKKELARWLPIADPRACKTVMSSEILGLPVIKYPASQRLHIHDAAAMHCVDCAIAFTCFVLKSCGEQKGTT